MSASLPAPAGQRRHRALRIHRCRSHGSAGLSLQGKRWGRPDDTFGIAGVVNGITREHEAFLNAGGLGILSAMDSFRIRAPSRSPETYYSLPVSFCR